MPRTVSAQSRINTVLFASSKPALMYCGRTSNIGRRPSLFGMKALFPEAETHARVSKDFGVSDCQGRRVLSVLAAGAQPVDAAVTGAAKAPSVHWPQFRIPESVWRKHGKKR